MFSWMWEEDGENIELLWIFFQSINVLLLIIDYVIYIMQRDIIETTFIHEFVERGK